MRLKSWSFAWCWLLGAGLSAGIPLTDIPRLGAVYDSTELLLALIIHLAIGLGLALPLTFLCYLCSQVSPITINNNVTINNQRTLTYDRASSFVREGILFWLFILAILSILLAAFQPGIWSIDSITHWRESGSMIFANWHPFAYPLFVAGVRALGGGPLALPALNIALISAVYGYLFFLGRLIGISRWLLLVILCLPLLNPAVSLFFLQVWKDVPFSALVMLSSCMVLHLCVLKIAERPHSPWFEFAIGAVSFLCLVLRHNGLLNVCSTLVAIFLFNLIPWRRTIFIGCSIFGCFAIFNLAGRIILQVPASPIGYNPIIYAMSAWGDASATVPSKDRLLLETIRRDSQLPWAYHCFVGDITASKSGTNPTLFAENSTELKALFWRLVRSDPMRAIRHALCVSSIVWRVYEPNGGATGVVTLNANIGSTPHYVEVNTLGISAQSTFPILRDYIAKLFDWSLSSPTHKALLWRPALHLYVLIFSIGVLITSARRALLGIAATAPLLAQLPVALVIGAPDHRYFFPMIWGAVPLLVFLIKLNHRCPSKQDTVIG